MKNKKDAEKLAEETLKSIDNITALDVNDFLFTRVQNRINIKKQVTETLNLKTMYRLVAMLVFFILINMLSFRYLANKNSTNYKSPKTSGLDAFASDYNLNETTENY